MTRSPGGNAVRFNGIGARIARAARSFKTITRGVSARSVAVAGFGTGVAFSAGIGVATVTDVAIAPASGDQAPLMLHWLATAAVGGAALLGWLCQKRHLAEAQAEGDGARPRDRYLDITTDLACVVGLDGRFRQVGTALAEFLGRAPEQLVRQQLWDFLHDEDRRELEHALARLAGGSQVESLQMRMRRSDGEYRRVQWTCPAVAPGEDFCYATGRERIEAEQAVACSPTLPSAQSADLTSTPDARCADATEPAGCTEVGDEAQLLRAMQRHDEGQPSAASVNSPHIAASSGEPAASPAHIQKTLRRRSNLRALLERQARLERAMHSAFDGLWDWDLATDCAWYAPRFRELLGYQPEDQFPESFASFEARLHPSDHDSVMAALRRHLENEEQIFDTECRLRTRRGTWKWFRVRGRSFRDKSGRPVRMAGALTERFAAEKKLREQEQQLQHSQRMEAVGELAGGVAHEFNNLMQAITGYARFAQQTLSSSSSAYADLEHLLSASERAATLTRQLLNFSRRDTIRPVPTSVADVLTELMAMLRPCIPESIDLQVDVRDEDAAICADPHLLQQVLMNLCVNARDAMDSVGTIVIRSQKIRIPADRATPSGDVVPGEYVEFSVSDTGPGVPEELRKRIFEPFFTTKETGKGTGMGLAMVLGVVQQHGGFVCVDGADDAGAVFRICLPLHQDEVREVLREKREVPAVGGDELILVAEDNAVVRDVVVRILEGAGYRTITAVDGEQAVELFSRHAEEIDMLLFDIVMPKMSGKEAAATIRLIQPDMPVAFCTGYDATSDAIRNTDFESTFIVEKPFHKSKLLQIVRAALDGCRRPCTSRAAALSGVGK